MNEETIGYRLDKIEETLKTMTDLLVTTQKQQDQIEILDTRQRVVESKVEKILAEVEKIKYQPAEHNSQRWEYITDYIFKGIVAAAVGFLFVKIGLN